MYQFSFKTDQESYEFCTGIARKMAELFGITVEQAVEQINARWEGQDILGASLVYHETEEYWARDIYKETCETRTGDGPGHLQGKGEKTWN